MQDLSKANNDELHGSDARLFNSRVVHFATTVDKGLMMYFFDKKRRKLHMSTILTDKVSLPLDTYVTGCNNNVAVIGSSGSGKTRSFVEPNVLQKNSSYIVSDAKGTILKDCGASLLSEKNGTEQYDIRVLNLQDMTRSMHYNPLKYVRSEQDVVFLANCIVLNTQSGDMRHTSDTFWQDQAVNLLTALIGYVAEVAPEKERNLNTVCRLFDLMNTKSDYCQNETDAIERLFENLKEDNPDSFAVRYYDEYAKIEGSGRAQASILASTAMCLAPYMLSPVKEVVRCDDMDIDSIDERPVALFIIYDDTDPTKNFLSNILYSQIFKILCHKADGRNDGMLARHVRLFLDDFYNVCIPNFDRYIATIRSRNISACIMLQNESQLEAKYPKIYKSVIDNCNSYLFTGTFDVYAAEEMSKRFGILPRDVLRLPPGYFLVSSNKKIYKDKRYIPERHPNYVADFFDVEDVYGEEIPEYEDQIVIAQREMMREAIKAETDDGYDTVDDIEADREMEQLTNTHGLARGVAWHP